MRTCGWNVYPLSFEENITRLFTTLLRFDAVYVGHFKCNRKRILDYPNLHEYLLVAKPVAGDRYNGQFRPSQYHYHYSHVELNPRRSVLLVPEQDLTRSHRAARSSALHWNAGSKWRAGYRHRCRCTLFPLLASASCWHRPMPAFASPST